MGEPAACTKLANDIMAEHGIYIQAINYPTVPRGQELLRVAPTPHHTKEMMDVFVEAVRATWQTNDMPLRERFDKTCRQCQKKVRVDADDAFSRHACDGASCEQYLIGASA